MAYNEGGRWHKHGRFPHGFNRKDPSHQSYGTGYGDNVCDQTCVGHRHEKNKMPTMRQLRICVEHV